MAAAAVLLAAGGAFSVTRRHAGLAATLFGLACAAILDVGFRLVHSSSEGPDSASLVPLSPSCWASSPDSGSDVVTLKEFDAYALVGAGDMEHQVDFDRCSATRVRTDGFEAVARVGRPIPPGAGAAIESGERFGDRLWLPVGSDGAAVHRYVTLVDSWYVEVEIAYPADASAEADRNTPSGYGIQRILAELADLRIDSKGAIALTSNAVLEPDDDLLTDWLMNGAPRYRMEYGSGGQIKLGLDEVSMDLDAFLTVDTYACGAPRAEHLAGRSDRWEPVAADGNDAWLLANESMNIVMTSEGCSLVVISSPLDRARSLDLIDLLQVSPRDGLPKIDLLAATDSAAIAVIKVEEGGGSSLMSVLGFAGPLLVFALVAFGIAALIRRRRRS